MAKGRPPRSASHPRPAESRAPAIAAKLRQAVAFHQRGYLPQAEALYREILAQAPRDFDALHLLGVVEAQKNNPAAAVDLIGRAIRLNSLSAEAHNNLGNALYSLERHGEALASYDRALALKPDAADALYNRGNALRALRRPEDALPSIERALSFVPHNPEWLNSRGAVLADLNRHAEALAAFEQALKLKPAYAEALNNRGAILGRLRRPEDALASVERALELEPRYAEAHNNRGAILMLLNRPEDALAGCERALALRPDYAEALNTRGNALLDLRRLEDALASCERALALRPDYAEALNTRGNALLDLRLHEQALASYRRALELRPGYAEALNNAGKTLLELKRYEAAVPVFKALVEADPDYRFARGRLLNASMLCCDWERFASLAESVTTDIRAGKSTAAPFAYQAVAETAQDIRLCSESYAAASVPRPPGLLWTGERYRNSRIRIGYVAGEFRAHATSFLLAGLMELHDRERFQLFAFDNGWDDGSEVRGRLSRAFDEIADISRSSDRDAAAMIRRKEIDILVDLNGYCGLARTGVFSHRPAPIQVNYLGFPGTMGVDYMDYIIADRHVIPPGHQAFYAEKIAYLPDTYQATDAMRPIAERTPGRAESGLPEAGFVFCCFNSGYKTTPRMFDIWMRLLGKVEGSVLWLLEDDAVASRNLRREAERRSIAPERLVFAPRLAQSEHLARHRVADLFLDTLPCNAHTTASDALWAGLPVLTCRGTTFSGRVAASVLHAIGLPELIADNLAEYEALALKLATAPAMLADIRRALERNRASHALFDTRLYCRHIEAAYIAMWERCQRGEAPETFSVQRVTM